MLEIVSPVPPSMALAFGGPKPFLRKAFIFQTRKSQALVVMVDGRPVAMAMLGQQRRHRCELALAFLPEAADHMRRLIRLAQLTLRRIAQTGTLVFVRIAPHNRQARRMARMTGFSPGRLPDPSIWLWKKR